MAEGPAATTARVVLVMEKELLQRVSTAAHLRTSGFDVIEAADGEEARRVLDLVPVDVVFADLAMPDQTNGLAFVRWLRGASPGHQRHSHIGHRGIRRGPSGQGPLWTAGNRTLQAFGRWLPASCDPAAGPSQLSLRAPAAHRSVRFLKRAEHPHKPAAVAQVH